MTLTNNTISNPDDLNLVEAAVLSALKMYGYEPVDAYDSTETVELIQEYLELPRRQTVVGYLSQLIQKGYAEQFSMDVNGTEIKFIRHYQGSLES